jgi:hypothetical protein
MPESMTKPKEYPMLVIIVQNTRRSGPTSSMAKRRKKTVINFTKLLQNLWRKHRVLFHVQLKIIRYSTIEQSK